MKNIHCSIMSTNKNLARDCTMYSILEKLENIERTLANPSYRGKRKSRENNLNIFLVSADNNTDWLIANKTQRDAIRSFQTGRVQPTREDARDS